MTNKTEKQRPIHSIDNFVPAVAGENIYKLLKQRNMEGLVEDDTIDATNIFIGTIYQKLPELCEKLALDSFDVDKVCCNPIHLPKGDKAYKATGNKIKFFYFFNNAFEIELASGKGKALIAPFDNDFCYGLSDFPFTIKAIEGLDYPAEEMVYIEGYIR